MTAGGTALASGHDYLTVLHGLRLSRIGRAADMAILHFGVLRSHDNRHGLAGQFALHIQCPWRLEGPLQTLTGQTDLRIFGGAGTTPVHWDYECGGSVQDQVLDGLFGPRSESLGWLNDSDRFVVTSTKSSPYGDLWIDFSNDHVLQVFPDSAKAESWRFFAPGADHHLVYRGLAILE